MRSQGGGGGLGGNRDGSGRLGPLAKSKLQKMLLNILYINKTKKPFNFTTNLTFADQPSAVGGGVSLFQKEQPGQRNLQMFLSVAEPENDASKFKLVQLLWGLKQVYVFLADPYYFERNGLYIGQGTAMISRSGIFRVLKGVAINMENRVFKLPSFHAVAAIASSSVTALSSVESCAFC
ncbi:hypothetical protein ACS0TY_030726 [Phlomoides rotata]